MNGTNGMEKRKKMSGDLISRSALLEKMENVHPNAYTPSHMIWLAENEPAAYDLDSAIKQLEQQKEQYFRRAEEIKNKFGENWETKKNYGKGCSYDHAVEIVKSAINTGHAAAPEDTEATVKAREEWIQYNTCRFCKGSHMHTCTRYSCPDAEKKAAEYYDSQIK